MCPSLYDSDGRSARVFESERSSLESKHDLRAVEERGLRKYVQFEGELSNPHGPPAVKIVSPVPCTFISDTYLGEEC